MTFSAKTVVVIGAKRSGLAAIALLRKNGAKVRVMDASQPTPDELTRLADLGAEVTPQDGQYLLDADAVVLSPGVPYDLPILVDARLRGVPSIGEVELASYFLQGDVIGITGSNGKTTTTALTGHLLRECGIPCQVGGNIGTAVTSLVETSSEDRWTVLELSSFQLESIQHFRARVAACLNVTPDHLDRHHTFEAYAAAKARIFENQRAADAAILNYDDAMCRDMAQKAAGTVFWFSSSRHVPKGIWLRNDTLVWDGTDFMRRSGIKLRGIHNVENVMAAALMAELAGAKREDVARAVSSFPGVEHRIEFVRELDGVEYYNDSKATNVDATLKAVDAFPGNLWVILGGKDKGSDYTPLREPLHSRAKGVLLIGAPPPYPYAAAPLIRKALEGAIEMSDCGSLEEAVPFVRRQALPGDTVLLAPACASFDQFQNYEERGKRFKHLVTQLF